CGRCHRRRGTSRICREKFGFLRRPRLFGPQRDSLFAGRRRAHLSTTLRLPLRCTEKWRTPRSLLRKTSSSCLRSLTPPEIAADLLIFCRNLKAPQHADALVVEAKAGREADGGAFRNVECDCRAEVLRGLPPAKAVAIAEPAIHFRAA